MAFVRFSPMLFMAGSKAAEEDKEERRAEVMGGVLCKTAGICPVC